MASTFAAVGGSTAMMHHASKTSGGSLQQSRTSARVVSRVVGTTGGNARAAVVRPRAGAVLPGMSFSARRATTLSVSASSSANKADPAASRRMSTPKPASVAGGVPAAAAVEIVNGNGVVDVASTTAASPKKFVMPALAIGAALAAFGPAGPAAAAAAAVATINQADTAWILISTALVLFMTIPGLSAFYAGIVKRKNMLSVLMQCFSLTCFMTILWYAIGYTLCFSSTGNSVIGGLDKMFLAGITKASVWETIPEALWALYQMTFAIITPALMVGSFVERMKFSSCMWYCALWMFAVYFPACHMVWGPDGFMAAQGVLDFAGGIVVHITAGIGALVGAAVLGPRKENKMVAGNLVLTVLGTGMLWVGWYGFNGGSALAAGADAAFACLATQIAAATAAIVWTLQDIKETGKASMLGIATGSIAGLATVTPCAGFVGPMGALMLGVAGGVICRFFSLVVKEKYGYDDSLDVFGVHGVGGFVGTCLLGVVAAPVFGGFNTDTTMMTQTVIQCIAAVATAAYTGVASYVCLMAAKAITGGDLRVPEGAEQGEGLDMWCHGESCYTLSEEETIVGGGGQPAAGLGA